MSDSERLRLQWGPRTADFRSQWKGQWAYRFADMYMLLTRNPKDGKGPYAIGEWCATCTSSSGFGTTAQVALDALREKLTARRDELSHFLTGVDADFEIWEFDILGQDQAPYLVGVASAGSFQEACDKYEQEHPEWSISMRTPRLTREQADERHRSIQ